MEATQEVVGFVGKDKQRSLGASDGEIAVMGKEGDIKTIWNPANEEEVAHARDTFDTMRKKGFLAFKVDKKGEKGEQINTFDPEAGKIIMCPQMRGG